MIIDANKVTLTDLQTVDAASVQSIAVENVIEKDKATEIARLLTVNANIKIVVVIDQPLSAGAGKYTHLEIVEALDHVRRLALLVFSSEKLENIEPLSGLTNLVSFELKGNYKKDLSLLPIQKALGLKELELEYGLSGKKQADFVNTLQQLERLKVSTLDLAQLVPNKNLVDLEVTNTLKNGDKLGALFPSLKQFKIDYAKGVETFDFLSALPALEQLTIGYTKKLVNLPTLANPAGLKRLALINTSEFADMDGILSLKNLSALKVNTPVNIPVAGFERLEQLESLHEVYVVFKTEEEDDTFAQLAEKKGWRLPHAH